MQIRSIARSLLVGGVLIVAPALIAGTLIATPAFAYKQKQTSCDDYLDGSKAQNDCFIRKGHQMHELNAQRKNCNTTRCKENVDGQRNTLKKQFESETD